MRDKFRLHEREIVFRLDDNESIAYSRLAVAKTNEYPPFTASYIDLLISQFGDQFSRISFYCRAPKNAKNKAFLLKDIAQYAVHVTEVTFEKCTVKDLASWTESSPSVEVLHLNSTQFADVASCRLSSKFPNVRVLTVEAIGSGSLKCIVDHFRHLEYFELVDRRGQPSRSDEIGAFLNKNRHIKSVSLRGGLFDLAALADSLSEVKSVRIYVADNDAFRANANVPHLKALRTLTIESDAEEHDLPEQLPYTFEQLTEFTLLRQNISVEWCDLIVNKLAGLTHLHLPAGAVSGPQLEQLFRKLANLEVLTVVWSRQVQEAAVNAMNTLPKLREVSFAGLAMSDVLQRKAILRQVAEQWTTVHDKSTADGVTTIVRQIESDDSEEDEDDQSHEVGNEGGHVEGNEQGQEGGHVEGNEEGQEEGHVDGEGGHVE